MTLALNRSPQIGQRFSQGFSVSGSSLQLMKAGERGTITKIDADSNTISKLRQMGITCGTAIALEQRFPRFIIKVGANLLTLDDRARRAIYVRIK
jgi:ferrous iron transport protein A